MKSQDSRGRRGRGPRRSPQQQRARQEPRNAPAPAPQTLWQKIVGFFKTKTKTRSGSPARSNGNSAGPGKYQPRKPESVEVTSTRLYVGNLSYEAAEHDLVELFKGVGAVRAAEVVAHRQTERSKGFGFVTMGSIDEARRAVVELHDKMFMGRKLVVSGAKTDEREVNYRG